MLLWLDLETTGIDPVNDHILEVAWRITNDSLIPWSVTQSRVVSPTADVWRQLKETPFVMDMHIQNGLLDDIDNEFVDKLMLEDIEDEILKDVNIVDGPWMVAGSSVHFDLALKLSHRIYDVTTLKTIFKSVGHVDNIGNDFKHRAASDIDNSYRYALMYRDILVDGIK
jgi:oligoribonuclease (3'-5' exoribonuclease)